MRVHLGSDHAGFELKAHLIAHLTSLGHEPVDAGPPAYDAQDDYPPYCVAAAQAVLADPGSLGIVIGGSGNGEQIAANKVPGIRCALAWSTETAQLGRQHNDAQVVAIGARMHSLEEAAALAETFVATPFSHDPRHQRRIDLVAEYERTGVAPPLPQPADPGQGTAGDVPEGHTLHRLAALHRRQFVGRPVAVSSPQGRFATDAELVDGRVLESAEAHGKHLFQHYGPDLVVHVHLGLYGKFSCTRLPADEPRGQVRMRMVGEGHYADLRGPTACELLTDDEVDAVHARLGADPLREDADPGRAWARISRSRAPLATLLMDQTVIAGVGNVFRAEALFRHGLDPQLPGRALSPARWDELWADLVVMLHDGVRRGKIDTLRPEHDPRLVDGVGPCARATYVYKRTGDPCLVCGTPVAHARHLARNLFWCPVCQAPERTRPQRGTARRASRSRF